MPHSTPNGQQIANAAKATKLNAHKRVNETHDGKRLAFTPADLAGKVNSPADLEAGQFVGIFETEFTDITIPPGKYNVFVTQIDGKWRAFAEENGKVVEAKSVLARTDASDAERANPKVFKGSGCFWVWLVFFGFNVCW